MNTKEGLISACERILWLERAMKDSYSYYANNMHDEKAKEAIREIEADEARHVNMAEKILSILKK